MKIQRSVLKGLIKECLIELLAEGLGTTTSLQESLTKNKQVRMGVPSSTQMKYSTPPQKEMISEVVKVAAGGDNVMASILEDTLRTSYTQQQKAEIPSAAQALRSAQIAETIDNQADNVEVMSEAKNSKSWSAIAFGK